MAGDETGATRIQLCGRLKADVRGRHVTPDLRGRQGRVLLAYLVLNRGRPVSRDELVAAIWPGEPPADPPAALRTQLSRLRSALGSESLAGRDAVELHLPEETWIDLEVAEQAIIAAQAALGDGVWTEAWARAHVAMNISGRPFLAGFEAGWVEEVRSELSELHMRSREIVARAGIGLGGSELAGAERAARALIRAAPFRESGYLLLMRALVASGNTAEALRTFDRLRHLLAEELGSAPGAEIQALHRRLLSAQPSHDAGDPAPPDADEAPAPAASLPLPTWLRPSERRFVGRFEELEALDRSWVEAVDGVRKIVLIGGEPGVGKTSLATEFADRVHSRGGRVLYGRTDERGSLRLQPFVEALRHWALNAPLAELRRDMGARPDALAALVPEIAVRLGDPIPSGPAPSEEDLFEAIAGTLAAIARDRPALLVIDDLHWADADSLLALRRIARSPHPGGLMIIATHRETEPSEALADAIADLGRERLFDRMHLSGLALDEVTELLGELQGTPPNPQLAAAIHVETDGNPFLVEALATHLGSRPPDAGATPPGPRSLYEQGVPDLVREAVDHRVRELGPQAVDVLQVASVIGREFDLGLLAEVSELSNADVAAALEAGVVARLVADVPGTFERYAFAHALFRQTIYLELARARRTALHRRLAELLEGRHGRDPRHLSQLARQYASAGPEVAPKAVEYGVRAGAGALGALAFDDAIDHYEDALGALDSSDTTKDDLRCELLIALGDAESMAGDDAAARETHSRAARLARLRERPDALARAALGFCRSGFEGEVTYGAEAAELLETALTAETAETPLRARLLARQAELRRFGGDREAAGELSGEALEVARKLGDDGALAAALIGRWYACLHPGGLPERRELTRELLALNVSAIDREARALAWRLQAAIALETGDPALLDSAVESHRLVGERQKDSRAGLQNRSLTATRALLRGDLEDAEQLTAELLQPGREGALGPGAVLLCTVRWELGRMGEMEDALRELSGRLRDARWSSALALLLAETDREEEAGEILDGLLADGANGEALEPGVLGMAAMAIGAARDTNRAEAVLEALRPYDGEATVDGVGTVFLGPAAHHIGVLEALSGREPEAAAGLKRAVEFSERADAPLWAERSRVALARLG